MPASAERVDLSILVPVYNGAPLVEPARAGITSALERTRWTFELVFVDDGSTDGSWFEICSAAAEDGRVRGLRLDHNVGQAAATAAGIPRTAGCVIVTTDVDLETDPDDLQLVVATVEAGHDVAAARRSERRHWSRQIPSSAFNAYVRGTGIPLRDIGCGTKALRRSVALEYAAVPDLRRELPTAVLTELTTDIVEVPMRSRRPRGSQLGFRHLVSLWLAFEGRRRVRGGRLGGGLLTTGFLTCAWGLAHREQRRALVPAVVIGCGLLSAAACRQGLRTLGRHVGQRVRPRVVEDVGPPGWARVTPASSPVMASERLDRTGWA